MGSTVKTYSNMVILATALVILSCASHASPIPGANPVLHSLATYATTNSFLYTNRFGTENYLLSKPQQISTKTHTNFIGFPQHQSFDLSTRHFSVAPISQNENPNIIPLGRKPGTTGEIKLLSSDINISPFLTPPKFPFLPQAGGKQVNDEITSNESTSQLERSTITPLEHLDTSPDPEYSSPERAEEEDVDSPLKQTSPTVQEFPNPTDGSTDDKSVSYSPISSNIPNIEDESNQASSRSQLEDLFNKVINAPVRTRSKNPIITGAPPSSDEMSILSRQDSSLEQPLPFFSTSTHKLSPNGILNGPQTRFQFPPLGTPNYRFTLPSRAQQQPPSSFPGINRFSSHNTPPSQRPVQSTQNQPQPSLSSSAPQLPLDQYSNNISHPSVPNSLNQQQFNFPSPPTQPQLPFPQHNGPPPQEPENGYNPFHLHENYPEPPYESEFANDPPLDDEEFAEQRQRSAGEGTFPPVLDFAQSTLRNVRTEELLDVVRRKQIPIDCIYNTISYGPNGEDCLEARKK